MIASSSPAPTVIKSPSTPPHSCDYIDIDPVLLKKVSATPLIPELVSVGMFILNPSALRLLVVTLSQADPKVGAKKTSSVCSWKVPSFM